MTLSRVGAIMIRHFYLMRGSFSRVLPMFLWVGIDMVLWGFMTRYLNAIASPGFNFIPVLLGSVLFWDFSIRVMQGVTMAFFEDVWSRNFLNIFATPLSISEYLAGLVLTSISTSLVGLAFMCVLASAVFGLSFFVYGKFLAAFFAILFLFGIALGVFASAMVLRLGPAAEWFVWPIPMILSPFVGVYYPLSTLPPWMRMVGRFLPPSYVFESVRSIIFGKPFSRTALFWGALLAILYTFWACWHFARVYRRALSSGLIARYSAETVS